MKALMCRAFGPPETLALETIPEPSLSAGSVLIRVHAAGVNFPDIMAAAGTYPIRSEPPFIPGIEGAGTIVAVADGVDRFTIGDRVCWQNNEIKSAFAEFIALPENCLVPVPAAVDLDIAAAVPVNYGTAQFALVHRATLAAGETVLVHGASGGTGVAAVQIAKALGATVIATGSSASKLEKVRALGADAVIQLGDGDFRDTVRHITDGRGVDVVFDPVGGSLFEPSIRALRPYGRMLSIGFTSGEFPVVPANILLVKAALVIGVNYGHHLVSDRIAANAALLTILEQVSTGRLRPHIHRAYRLEDTVEAIKGIVNREVVGKNIVHIDRAGAN